MIRLILILAASISAAPCVILSASDDLSSVVVTCQGWPTGLTRSLRAPTPSEWKAVTGFDTIKADTTRGAK